MPILVSKLAANILPQDYSVLVVMASLPFWVPKSASQMCLWWDLLATGPS